MKVSSVSLAVSLNFIAIALAAPTTTTAAPTTTTTPSQETGYPVDSASNSLNARDFYDDISVPVSVVNGHNLDVQGTPGTSTYGSGMDSGVYVVSGADPGYGREFPGVLTAGTGTYYQGIDVTGSPDFETNTARDSNGLN